MLYGERSAPPPPFCLKSSQRRQTRSTNMTENISYKSSYSGNREAERHRKHSMSILNDLTQYYESFEALQRTYSPYRPMVRRLKTNTWFHLMCHGKSILIVNITKTIPLVCFIWKPHHYLEYNHSHTISETAPLTITLIGEQML